jgi:hypothetical protein
MQLLLSLDDLAAPPVSELWKTTSPLGGLTSSGDHQSQPARDNVPGRHS